MAKLQKDINDLKTWCLNNGEFGQQLLSEWTGECEDGFNYSIDEVARATPKRVKWKCSEGHEWIAGISVRTSSKSKCPYCSGHKVSSSNSLLDWCINNGEFGERLMKEWTGLSEDNQRIDLRNASFGNSKLIMLWKCSRGHEWYSTIQKRTSRKTECPSCGGKRAANGNDLESWCLANGQYGKELMSQWTGVDQLGNRLNIYSISRGSSKKVQWKCVKNHFWYQTVSHRTLCRTGCPFCSGYFVSENNSLMHWCEENGEFGKQLISEWAGELEDGTIVTMSDVTKSTTTKAKWRCNRGHEWFTSIASRTHGKSGCPHCYIMNKSNITAKSKLHIGTNDLSTWCLNNGDWGKQLSQEWTGQCEDEKYYEINEVSFGSGKKLKWKCNKGHEWYATVSSRTCCMSCCPYCSPACTSYPEQILYRSMLQLFPNTIHRGKYQGYEFDITIPEIKTCIEYGALVWHADKLDRDNEKKELCEKHGVQFIQIYAHSGEIEEDDIFDKNFIVYRVDYSEQEYQLKHIIEHILNQFNYSIEEIDFEKACTDAFNFMHSIEEDADGGEP